MLRVELSRNLSIGGDREGSRDCEIHLQLLSHVHGCRLKIPPLILKAHLL